MAETFFATSFDILSNKQYYFSTIADASVTYDVVRNYGDLREMIMR